MVLKGIQMRDKCQQIRDNGVERTANKIDLVNKNDAGKRKHAVHQCM